MSTSKREYKAKTVRGQTLLDAALAVGGHRGQGDSITKNSFGSIASLWTTYTGHTFTAHDVAMMMCLLKIAKSRNGGGSDDSYVNLAGYAACAGELIRSDDDNDGS